MRAYVIPVQAAITLFPLVAVIFTLPYLAVQYRRYGAILAVRAAIVYSFILYLMCAFFLVILPLPSLEMVKSLTSPAYQLFPFQQGLQMFQNPALDITNPATWYNVLWNQDFFQIVANAAMFAPLGIYLRYFFGRSAKQVFWITLSLSVFFEVTQFTGLWFMYPRAYRLADVDDLISNTLGGMAGYWLAPLFMRVLPPKEKLDAWAYQRGTFVSFTRRATAAVADGLLMGTALVAWIALDQNLRRALLKNGPSVACLTVYIVGVAVYFMLGEWLWKGATPGKRLLHIRLVDIRTGGAPRLWQTLVRYGLLYLVLLPIPLVFFLVRMAFGLSQGQRILLLTLVFLLVVICALFWLVVLIHTFTHSIQLPHDKISRTRNISTLLVVEEMLAEVGMKPNMGEEVSLEEEPPSQMLN